MSNNQQMNEMSLLPGRGAFTGGASCANPLFMELLRAAMASAKAEAAEEVVCCECDYTISQVDFDKGKGRIMYSDVVPSLGWHLFRCGCCDDRCSDPQGCMIDDDDE